MTEALDALRARLPALPLALLSTVPVGAAPLVLVPVGPEKVRMGEVGMKFGSGEVMGREDMKVRRAPSEAEKVV